MLYFFYNLQNLVKPVFIYISLSLYMKLWHRFILAILLITLSWLYIVPWEKFGIDIAILTKPYILWLDLQWGVELDYKVDFDGLKNQTGAAFSEQNIIEGIKSVIDKRVNSLGLAEPTIQTAKYGDESHIIVQIPTRDYGNVSDEEKRKKSMEDTEKAKATIGKVVQLEFREQKTTVTDADKEERKELANKAWNEIQSTPFATVWQKYRDQYENIVFASGTGSLPPEAQFPGIEKVEKFPYYSPILITQGNIEYSMDKDGNPTIKSNTGYALVELQKKTGSGTYAYSYIFIDERASSWAPAKTADGKVLWDKYLVNAGVGFTQGGQPQVELLFNDEGKKIFAELTKRLLGKQIAIFVGGQMLTAPTVQAVIPDGRAVITGDYTVESAQKLANDINTGIVPAPIYLTSERTIDAKIGSHALREILIAGFIGLVLIVCFLTYFYRVSGLLAGVALIAYTLFLVALVKFFGPVLTLASIAGIILSIGLAIDANILIFERMREALHDGQSVEKAIHIGFDKSWTAIWDSHITSLTSAVILYLFGISLIKGFGFMLGLGIVLSLFTAMWVSRVLIEFVGKKMTKHMFAFIWEKK
jgi:protein-export membrane protein SecD